MSTEQCAAPPETAEFIRSHRPGDRRIMQVIGPTPEEFEGEQFWNCNIVRFDNKTYVFSHRAILTLVVVATCNAACKFCSNEVTFTPGGPYLRWGPRLQRAKDFALTAGVRKVAFTGGEPTLNPQRLLDLATKVIPGFSRARLHTNGYGLFHRVRAPRGELELLSALRAVGLTGASLSVAHHDPAKNKQVMRFSAAWDGMADDALRQVASHRSDTFTPRLSCVMTHEGVHTVPDLLEYIEWGRSLGFRHFIFRSCSDIPDEFRKPTGYSTYNAANYIPIEPLVEELDRLPGIDKTYRERKSDSKVDCYRWRDVQFDVDESGEEPDPDRKIRRLNVMANGVVYTCWIDPLAVLFDDDLPAARKGKSREFGHT